MGSSPNSNAKSSTGKEKTGLKQDMPEKMPTCCIQTTGFPCEHNLLPNEGLHPHSSPSIAEFTKASGHFCTLDLFQKFPMSLSCLLSPTSLLLPSESKENSKLEVEKTELVDYAVSVRPFSSQQPFCWYLRLQSTACKTIADYKLVFVPDFILDFTEYQSLASLYRALFLLRRNYLENCQENENWWSGPEQLDHFISLVHRSHHTTDF